MSVEPRPPRVALLALVLTGCAPAAARPPEVMAPVAPTVHRLDPSLLELARVEPPAGHRALLVVYPRTACAGSAPTVLVDERGGFLGALAPGAAALLSVPVGSRRLLAFSSVEVTAPAGAWSAVEDIALGPPPSGVILLPRQVSGRQCGRTGQYAEARVASRAELEELLGGAKVAWRSPRDDAGRAWLGAHRARVEEILERHRASRYPEMDDRQ